MTCRLASGTATEYCLCYPHFGNNGNGKAVHSLQLTAQANIETNPIQPLSWAKPVGSPLASWCANEVSDPYRPNFVLGFADVTAANAKFVALPF